MSNQRMYYYAYWQISKQMIKAIKVLHIKTLLLMCKSIYHLKLHIILLESEQHLSHFYANVFSVSTNHLSDATFECILLCIMV